MSIYLKEVLILTLSGSDKSQEVFVHITFLMLCKAHHEAEYQLIFLTEKTQIPNKKL